MFPFVCQSIIFSKNRRGTIIENKNCNYCLDFGYTCTFQKCYILGDYLFIGETVKEKKFVYIQPIKSLTILFL